MKFVKAETQNEFFSLMLIRAIVFMREQQVDPLIELDEEDCFCDQYIVYEQDKIIATCRVVSLEDSWHIGRVSVLKEYRHHHYGTYMLKEIEALALKAGIKRLELGAQLHAIPFYEKNGYACYGEVYVEADIEHCNMEKYL